MGDYSTLIKEMADGTRTPSFDELREAHRKDRETKARRKEEEAIAAQIAKDLDDAMDLYKATVAPLRAEAIELHDEYRERLKEAQEAIPAAREAVEEYRRRFARAADSFSKLNALCRKIGPPPQNPDGTYQRDDHIGADWNGKGIVYNGDFLNVPHPHQF